MTMSETQARPTSKEKVAADTTILLEIRQSKQVPHEAGDEVPWRIAMVPIPSELRRVGRRPNGHRLKKRGYYYRFSGGNALWDDETPTGDGDFRFDRDTGDKTVVIELASNSRNWKIVDVKDLDPLGPLVAAKSGGNTVTITDHTSNKVQTSGRFGVKVASEDGVELYCDPDWDND
jgi:hypothetical protein